MVGKILKNLRETKGLKQDELGKMLNLSASSIGMYERNERDTDTDTLQKIAEIFDVTTDYLLDNVKDMTQNIVEDLRKIRSLMGTEKLCEEDVQKIAEELSKMNLDLFKKKS